MQTQACSLYSNRELYHSHSIPSYVPTNRIDDCRVIAYRLWRWHVGWYKQSSSATACVRCASGYHAFDRRKRALVARRHGIRA